MGEGHPSSSGQRSRVSVYRAAEVMGVTVDAIRKRVSRDTIPHERDEDGRVWVLLDTDQDAASNIRDTDRPRSASDALISEMRDRIESLERQLEQERQANSEHRRLLAAALERIPPQLEAPRASETVEEEPEGSEPPPAGAEAQAATWDPQAQRPREGEEHDTANLRSWSSDVEDRPRPEAPGAQEGARRPWWRRWFGG